MTESSISRRTFLAASGLGAVSLACAANSVISRSPSVQPALASTVSLYDLGQYHTSAVILGEDAGTTALPQPFDKIEYPNLPLSVLAAVYYPDNTLDHRAVPTPNPLNVASGPFPILLYAHAARNSVENMSSTDTGDQDYKSVEAMLRHVASYGCVCIAPDLSWIPYEPSATQRYNDRAVVLVNYYEYLVDTLNSALFANQLDKSRVIVVGHSTGAGSAGPAGRIIAGFGNQLKSLSFGLIAPDAGSGSGSDIHNLLVLGGGRDTSQGANPQIAYANGGTPKSLALIPGGITSATPAFAHQRMSASRHLTILPAPSRAARSSG